MPATGREVAVDQTHWYRIRDRLVVEHRMNHDGVGMRSQLGLAG